MINTNGNASQLTEELSKIQSVITILSECLIIQIESEGQIQNVNPMNNLQNDNHVYHPILLTG